MTYTGSSSPVRNQPVLPKDHVYPQEPLINYLIHYTCGMHPLSWIQRWRCWQLSTTHRTLYSNVLILWRGGHGGQALGARGFLVGGFAWWHCWSRVGSGDQSFTFVIIIPRPRGECRFVMTVVDSLDTVFSIKVKENFGHFGLSQFCDLAMSPQIKCLFVPGCCLNVPGVLILLLFMRGGDGLGIQILVAVLDLGNQGGFAGFTKKLPEEFLGKGRILEEVLQEGSNLLVLHLNEVICLFTGRNDFQKQVQVPWINATQQKQGIYPPS
jgi:hypothetical protein